MRAAAGTVPGLAEAELAAACLVLAERFPALAPSLERLAQQHLEMAVGALAPEPDVPTTLEAALEWLRDRELALARRYVEQNDALALEAWDRYRFAERLVALYEFGELTQTF